MSEGRNRHGEIAAATNGVVPATRAQVDRIVELCLALFRYHGRSEAEVRSLPVIAIDNGDYIALDGTTARETITSSA